MRHLADPGLDRAALLALRHTRDPLEISARIDKHLQELDGYVAFSGGKDSLVTLDLALQAEPNIPVVFFDSGFEFPETYSYIRQVADLLDVDLRWINAQHSTLELLVQSKSWQHDGSPTNDVPNLHRTLITEPAGRAHVTFGPGELWGVRSAESQGRRTAYAVALRDELARRCTGPACCPDRSAQRQHHGGIIRRDDGTVAFGPIWDWSDDEVWGHIARRRLPTNPVYAKLRRLGAPNHFLRISHMLDGARLEHGRVTWLRRGWPELFEELCQYLPRLREFV